MKFFLSILSLIIKKGKIPDKNYTLKNGDIESIPIYNARMLSDAGKVKLLKGVKV